MTVSMSRGLAHASKDRRLPTAFHASDPFNNTTGLEMRCRERPSDGVLARVTGLSVVREQTGGLSRPHIFAARGHAEDQATYGQWVSRNLQLRETIWSRKSFWDWPQSERSDEMGAMICLEAGNWKRSFISTTRLPRFC